VPLFWTFDSRARLATVVAEGAVTIDDIRAYVEAAAGARALGYRKLFDGRQGVFPASEYELIAAGAEFRRHDGFEVGALAVVLTAAQTQQLVRLLAILAAARRPVRIFSSDRSARHWLETQ
jgi:hypothetical protein